ncbi:MAG: SDR family oxidoreductase [Deltaproteobacteria bacterium]|nr:SDR family oxidoreductase [Deltaproteobacteria bacterium]
MTEQSGVSGRQRPGLFAPDLLRGSVAVVTGGGSGIGLATAELLGRCGASLALAGRSVERLEAAAARMAGAGIEVFFASCDIRESAQTEEFAKLVLERFGRIDILVNNAGGQFPTPAEDLTSKGWDAVIRTNLTGTWNMTRAAAVRAMIPARSGRIVNVIADVERGFPGMVHTGAARAGVENMTRTLAVEWAGFGLAVNAVAPGVIRTAAVSKYGEPILEARRREIPLRRLGAPEEVAEAVCFLASPAAAYITGVTLAVDGGARLAGHRWPIELGPDERPAAAPGGAEGGG